MKVDILEKNDRLVLARWGEADGKGDPIFVVWVRDPSGDLHSPRYFASLEEARENYLYRSR